MQREYPYGSKKMNDISRGSSDFNLRVYSPSGLLFEEAVTSVYVPGLEGEIGILPQHAHYLGALGTGLMRFTTTSGGETGKVVVSGGFARMRGNDLEILADQVILPDQAETMDFTVEIRQLETELGKADSASPWWAMSHEKYLRYKAVEELRKG